MRWLLKCLGTTHINGQVRGAAAAEEEEPGRMRPAEVVSY
jgi:hypothetical protein